jgi:hypothetical protein
MALFPETPKEESQNCPGWTPGTLGTHISWLQPPIGVRSMALLENFPMPYRTPSLDVRKRSILDF